MLREDFYSREFGVQADLCLGRNPTEIHDHAARRRRRIGSRLSP